MAAPGGPSALRGYRLQTLYALYRVVAKPAMEGTKLRLEGDEDLVFETGEGVEFEFVQVKAHSRPLTLYDLDATPRSEGDGRGSFLRRALDRAQAHPETIQRLVSFGPLGPELAVGWFGVSRERDAITDKLALRYGRDEIDALFENVHLDLANEEDVEATVHSWLREGVLGGDPRSAFELLSYWLHRCSEDRSCISSALVQDKLLSVGKYLADRVAHTREWFTSIIPIGGDESVDQNVSELRREFYQGIGARYHHIAAGTDVGRPEKLERLAEAFGGTRIVIVHGASGQGKSALAYRYLHDFVPRELSFEVRSIEGIRHAQSISRALLGHVAAMGTSMHVYIDVQPRDTAWLELLDQLAKDRDVRLLVTVREEDWTRATGLSARVDFQDLELIFNKDEARLIFDQLIDQAAPVQIVDFEDAWRRFGEGQQLLEFVYLVTQNERLRARLEQQVAVLQEELDPGALRFLHAVAVASAYGARLKLGVATQRLKLTRPAHIVRRLEREYLIRSSPDGAHVEGLHAIRSSLLVELLTDAALSPWLDAARAALPAMAETDIEVFLLHAFSRRPEDRQSLLDDVMRLEVDSWTGAGGILRVLLWLGIREHVDTNRALLDDAHAAFGTCAGVMLVWDVAGVAATEAEPLSGIEHWDFLAKETRETIAQLRQRRKCERADFAQAREYLLAMPTPPTPTTATDWEGLADAAFWAGFWGLRSQWLSSLAALDFEPLLSLDLPSVCDVLFGLSLAEDPAIEMRVAGPRQSALRRFRQDSNVVLLDDDGITVRAHFLIGAASFIDPGPGVSNPHDAGRTQNIVHDAAMRSVRLLRKLLPDRSQYCCQGYGHRIPGLEFMFGDATKTGIPRSSLPPQRATSLNFVFSKLADLPFRLADWREHAERVIDLRRRNLEQLHELHCALAESKRSQLMIALWGERINPETWASVRAAASAPSLTQLPKVAVDEWGFTGEGEDLSASRQGDASTGGGSADLRRTVALWQHGSYLEALRAFAGHVEHFYRRSGDLLVLEPLLRQARSPRARRQLRSALGAAVSPDRVESERTATLATVIALATSLQKIQEEFRRRFARFFDQNTLADLDARERQEAEYVCEAWHDFVTVRALGAPTRGGRRRSNTGVRAYRERLLENLAVRFSRLQKDGIHARILLAAPPTSGEPGLWISIETDDIAYLWAGVESVIAVVAERLTPSSRSERRAIDHFWPELFFVPICAGKALDRVAFRCLTSSLNRGAGRKNAAQGMQVPIDPCQWDCLGLDLWHSIPQIEVMNRLYGNIGLLRVYLSSLADLHELANLELDDVGRQVLDEFNEQQSAQLSTTLSAIVDAWTELFSLFEQVEREEVDARPHVRAMMELLVDIKGALLPFGACDDGLQLDGASICEWRDRLEASTVTVELFRLHWIADVLSGASAR